MTPKEKAKDLVFFFYKEIHKVDVVAKYLEESQGFIPAAKQCALISVDEIIISIPLRPLRKPGSPGGASFWLTVKEEINKI